jgi:hypothetical protein
VFPSPTRLKSDGKVIEIRFQISDQTTDAVEREIAVVFMALDGTLRNSEVFGSFITIHEPERFAQVFGQGFQGCMQSWRLRAMVVHCVPVVSR